jgi:hypothetical protein
MNEDLKKLRPTTANLVTAAIAEYEFVKANIPMPPDVDEDLARVVIAENVIRRAIEACVDAAAGFGFQFCEELATRLASYAISIAPDKQHERMVNRVRKALPACHAARMRQGVRIDAEWADVPDRGKLN